MAQTMQLGITLSVIQEVIEVIVFFDLYRKFADIEASNQRLASALYLKEERKNTSSLPSQEPGTLDQTHHPFQDTGVSSVHEAADGVSKSPRVSKSNTSVDSHQGENGEKKQPEPLHLWKQPLITTCNKKKQSKAEQKEENKRERLVEFLPIDCSMGYKHHSNNESLPQSSNILSGDSETTHQDSGFVHFDHTADMSPTFSPEPHQLSLDSCNFSMQTSTDISACTEARENVAEVSESQWTDIVDLFRVGNKNVEGFLDIEAYFESICACQSDNDENGINAGHFLGLTEKTCSNTSEDDNFQFVAAEDICEDASGCQETEVQRGLRQNEEAAETHFNTFRTSHCIIQNQLPTAIHHQADVSTQHSSQGRSPCMLTNNQTFTPFEGVAQSFTVPLHGVKHYTIPTPPHEDDWLFTYILEDGTWSDY